MPYDKYQNWPLPSREGNVFPAQTSGIDKGSEIEEQVLLDLVQAMDVVDKLEILDSYAAYAQRAYRKEFAESLAIQAGDALGQLLIPLVTSRMPDPRPGHRARPVPPEFNDLPNVV